MIIQIKKWFDLVNHIKTGDTGMNKHRQDCLEYLSNRLVTNVDRLLTQDKVFISFIVFSP